MHSWSVYYKGPYIILGRPGALGSSGHAINDRRTLLEIHVVAAALDALKERFGYKRLHIVGHSGGGHVLAALLQKRADIGCAVIASASVSVKAAHLDAGRPLSKPVLAAYDPIDYVAAMRDQPGRRVIVLSDPDDEFVSFRSQRAFVDRVKAKGLPILHITTAAAGKGFHDLVTRGGMAAIDCVRGLDDDDLIKRYQNKVPRT